MKVMMKYAISLVITLTVGSIVGFAQAGGSSWMVRPVRAAS